ncbi:MAG: hypothetical protein ACJ8IQ_04150 [Chthoniobacterales bacterium]
MRITNSKHVPWFLFTLIATAAATWLYVGNFYPERLSGAWQLPDALRQTPSDHRSIGGTPLGLWFGSIALAIFVFAVLLSARKKVRTWPLGRVQRWMRAHIWLTLLTIPLVLFHSGFRLGGPMTTLIVLLYAIVMVSGIYGLILQHKLPTAMKERLPAERVFDQITRIRAQLCAGAEEMRDALRQALIANPDGAVSPPLATKVTRMPGATAEAKLAAVAATSAPTHPGPPLAREATVEGGSYHAPAPRAATISATAADTATGTIAESARAMPPPPPEAPLSAPAIESDIASEATLLEFIEKQVLPYLQATNGEHFRFNNARFAEETFRMAKVRVAPAYRERVAQLQGWCDERRMQDLQTRMQHWLHGWLFVHAPLSFLLLIFTFWHAYVTLFYY